MSYTSAEQRKELCSNAKDAACVEADHLLDMGAIVFIQKAMEASARSSCEEKDAVKS